MVPAFAIGAVISLDTTTTSVAVQPFAVFVTVRVYVFGVFAVGSAINEFDKPAEGDQEYVYPEIAGVPILTDGVVQFNVLSTPAFAVGKDPVLVMLTWSEEKQLFVLFVTVTV